MHLPLNLLAILLVSSLFGCDYNRPEDYDAKKDFRAFQEAQQATKSDGGATVDPAAAAMAKAKKDYGMYCASCHGADGAANSPTAAALNPKPRAFTDAKWQASVDDAHIAKVIKEGGAAVGLSPTMAPWGASLSDEQIAEIVKVVRSFK